MQKYRTGTREKIENLDGGGGREEQQVDWFDNDARIRIVEPTTGQRNTILTGV